MTRTVFDRSDTLRRRHRRILGWSIAAAVVIHVLVLFFVPWLRTDPLPGPGTELVERRAPRWGGIPVDVFFGPPAIALGDGSVSQEPPSRVLRASRIVPAPTGCSSVDWLAREAVKGEVRLTVNERGRASAPRLAEGTGDACWDRVLEGVASDLLYRWLPSERFPAPVSVHQPMTVTLSR